MRLQISIGGFHPQPITLLGTIHASTGVLAIAKQTEFREERIKVKEGEDPFAFVTNLDVLDCDFRFTDDHFRDAIRAFFRRLGQQTVVIDNPLMRFDPTNRIERDAVDEKGPKYRISPDIDNGQVAVLAAAAFAEAQKPIQSAISAMEDLREFYTITTIGG